MLYNNTWRIYGTLIVSVDFLLLCCLVFFVFSFRSLWICECSTVWIVSCCVFGCVITLVVLILGLHDIGLAHALDAPLFFSFHLRFFQFFLILALIFSSLCRHNTSSSKQYLTECAMARNIIFFFSIEIFGLDWANLCGLNWFLCYTLYWYFVLFLEKSNRKSFRTFRKSDFLFSFFSVFMSCKRTKIHRHTD